MVQRTGGTACDHAVLLVVDISEATKPGTMCHSTYRFYDICGHWRLAVFSCWAKNSEWLCDKDSSFASCMLVKMCPQCVHWLSPEEFERLNGKMLEKQELVAHAKETGLPHVEDSLQQWKPYRRPQRPQIVSAHPPEDDLDELDDEEKDEDAGEKETGVDDVDSGSDGSEESDQDDDDPSIPCPANLANLYDEKVDTDASGESSEPDSIVSGGTKGIYYEELLLRGLFDKVHQGVDYTSSLGDLGRFRFLWWAASRRGDKSHRCDRMHLAKESLSL